MTDARSAHWEKVYTDKAESEVSWFERQPSLSLELIAAASAGTAASVIDIGGGASRLAGQLLASGYRDISVLDISEAALKAAANALGARAGEIDWIVSDITRWEPTRAYDVWHDRAAFHFLTDAVDRTAYVDRLRQALKPGGSAIFATFAPDGPEKCSGLQVVRHDAESIGRELGPDFRLLRTERRDHETPWGALQSFQISVFRYS